MSHAPQHRAHYRPKTRTQWRRNYSKLVRAKMVSCDQYIHLVPEACPRAIRQPLSLGEWIALEPEARAVIARDNMRAEVIDRIGPMPEALEPGTTISKSELQRRVLAVPHEHRAALFDSLVARYKVLDD